MHAAKFHAHETWYPTYHEISYSARVLALRRRCSALALMRFSIRLEKRENLENPRAPHVVNISGLSDSTTLRRRQHAFCANDARLHRRNAPVGKSPSCTVDPWQAGCNGISIKYFASSDFSGKKIEKQTFKFSFRGKRYNILCRKNNSRNSNLISSMRKCICSRNGFGLQSVLNSQSLLFNGTFLEFKVDLFYETLKLSV